MQRRSCAAYLTIYLALILSVLLSLGLALIEGVRSNAIRLESECVMDIGLNSILAEYHRELFGQYNLFAIDSSYGTASVGSANTADHLMTYLNRNLAKEGLTGSEYLYRDFLGLSATNVKMTRVSLLTDEDGTVFRRRAVEAMRDDLGLAGLDQLLQWMEVVDSNDLLERDIEEEKRRIDDSIEDYNGREVLLPSEEWVTIEVENPTEELERVRRAGILKKVVVDEQKLSGKALRTDTLVGTRMERGEVNRGNIAPEKQSDLQEVEEAFLFREYLLHYMGNYLEPKEQGALNYQAEYLIAGRNADVENLQNVANRLCGMREVANVIYLYSDAEKCAEADAVAMLVAVVLLEPDLQPLLKASILLGWAYAESLCDVKTLLAGGRVPLMKDASSWHCGLTGALLGQVDTGSSDTGLAYKDYLRILLMTEQERTLTKRAMNMVEADIRLTPGNQTFRLDACIDRVEASVQIESSYGYSVEIVREKKY